MQQNENDDPIQNQNNQETVLQQERQEQQDEDDKKAQATQEQQNGNENQNEQTNNTSENTNNQQQELNKEKTTLDTDLQGETLDAQNEKEQQGKKEQTEQQQEDQGNKQNSINDQTIENSQDAQLSNNKEVKQEKEGNQSNRSNQQEQGQNKEQKQQKEGNLENQGQRGNQKKKTTKRRTTKVEVQENQEQNNPSQSNNDISQQKQETDQNNQEKAELEANQKQIEEQQQKEELQKKEEQEQQEKLHKQQLRDKFFKSMIFPLRTQNKKGKQFNLTFEIESEKLQVKMRECKSAHRYQKEKKPRTKSAINKELFDFFNTMNPQKHIGAMTPNTLQRRKKQQELDQMRKDCEKLEEQQQITQSLPQKEQRSSIHNKQRTSTYPKKKLEVYVRKRKKVKARNGLRERMLIDKDKDSQLKALDFIRKMQQNRMAAEQKRQEQLEKLSLKISSKLEHLRLGNQRYKEEQQKQKRKQALEQINKQEQKRYEMMLEQQKNERFVRELKEKAGVSSYYSAKKLALGSPASLVQEFENGQIKIEQNIDTNRKMNENQFILKDEQKKGIKDNKPKQQDQNKQVSLLQFPKVNAKKNFELVNQYLSAENKEALPEIKPKRKKAWQIEQELKQKRLKQ